MLDPIEGFKQNTNIPELSWILHEILKISVKPKLNWTNNENNKFIFLLILK